MKSVRILLAVLMVAGQSACLRNRPRLAGIPPLQTPVESEAEEAQSARRGDEWFNLRHFDGGLRQRAVEEKQRLTANASGTPGVWRAIGPEPIQTGPFNHSGRVWGIGVDPRDSRIVYIGTDGGGVWKTTDGGANWTPLTDQQANLNIRSLALAPSAPDTILAGTAGGGILKSIDAGAHWTTVLPGVYVQSLAIHPTNPSVILAADGFLYRSVDGGATWTQPMPSETGATEVAFDPSNGDIAYAPTNLHGIYRTADSGRTWSPIGGAGLASGDTYNLAIAPSRSTTLYVAVKKSSSLVGFYRSFDSGATWTQIGTPFNDDVPYWGWSLRVHPLNPNLIYAGSLWLWMSTDGGLTWAQNGNVLHIDHHVQAYSADGTTLYAGNDGGIWRTYSPTAANTSWTNLNATLNTAMFYPGMSIHPTSPSISLGGTQDNGVLRYEGNPIWTVLVCGDGGFTAIDPVNPQNIYMSCDAGHGIFKSSDGGVSFQPAQTGINTMDGSDFIPPMVMDPSNPKRLYFGTNRVYQTADGANSWAPISPALSGASIATIAVAPSDTNTVYAGGGNGRVFTSRNALSGAGATWSDRNLPGPLYITQITVDPQNALTAWAATGYPNDPGQSPVYRTTDGGLTWASMSLGLPHLTVSDILVDPDIPNTIYAATDIGVYSSSSGGQSWLPLGTGMPNVICHSLRLFRPTHTLRVATYGRGMWDLETSASAAGTLTLSHVGNFQQGQPQGTYTISVRNAGSVPGSGNVTVADTLPAALIATGIAGPGWACSLSNLSCSRSDSLVPGAAYPPIAITVRVPPGGPTQTSYYLNNQASLSGGLGTAVTTDLTTIQIPFGDVASTDLFLPAIDLMWESSITTGCGGPMINYCPNDNITLGQMAVFVVRSVMGGDDFTYTQSPYFTDVPATHQFFKWIQKMQDLGIALPCAPVQYCPETPVTRGVMAVLIIRSRYGVSSPSAYPATAYFTDAPATHPYFPWIQKMKQIGITAGCGATTYCPNDPVTRGQMAVFIERGEFNQVLPASTAIVAWISQVTASPGQSVTLTIAGQNTNFANGLTQVSAGPGIAVSNISVASGTALTAQLSLVAGAALGPRSITVTTNSEEATLPNGFHVQ